MNDKILQFLLEEGEATPNQIVEKTGFSRQYIHRILADLQAQGKVIKLGRPPLVYYQAVKVETTKTEEEVSVTDREFLQADFIEITEDGRLLEGLDAFSYWCQKRKLPVVKTISEYRQTLGKYSHFYDSQGFIDGTEKIKGTKGFGEIHLTAVYYLEFYAIERFGKTRYGQLLHFAKQGQNKKLSAQLIQLAIPRIVRLIQVLEVQAIGFIPPTIKRQVQFMTLLENQLKTNLPKVKLIKVKGEVVVPQKALSKIEDRILNANRSIMAGLSASFEKVLLIDDAVGSGATLNEAAGKLRLKGIASQVFGVAITGSFKGFEVISEA